MTDGFLGMDPHRVSDLANRLEQTAARLDLVNTFVDSTVNTLQTLWHGADVVFFHGSWRQEHRPQISSVSDEVAGWVALLRRQLADQIRTSAGTGPNGARSFGNDPHAADELRARGGSESRHDRDWAIDMAKLARDSYGDSPEGTKVGDYTVVTRHRDGNLDYTVYSYTRPDGSTAYVVAFGGSASVGDWIDDGANAFDGRTDQYADAIAEAKRLVSKYGGPSMVTFTGHSLGGGLAQVASISTGAPAFAYNSANPGEWAIREARFSADDGLGSGDGITRFSTVDDPVTNAQHNLHRGDSSQGQFITLEDNHHKNQWNPLELKSRHNMEHVIEELKADRSGYLD